MGTQTSLAATDVSAGPAAALLAASGIEKSYRRGMWPARRRRPVPSGWPDGWGTARRSRRSMSG